MNIAAMTSDGLTLFLFGPFELRRPSGEAVKLPGGHARVLLQRLAASASNAVPSDALIGALWGDEPPPSAARTLASLISRLRATLGAGTIEGSTGAGYRLALGAVVTTDLAQAEALTAEAATRLRDAPSLTVSAAQRALDAMDRGPLLNGRQIDAAWYDELHRHATALRRRAQRLLWEGESQLGQWDRIIEGASDVLAHDAYDEEATRAIMTAYWHHGDRGSALHAHEVLRAHLRQHLGTEPSAETDALYHKIATTGVAADDPASPGPTGRSEIIGRERELGLLIEAWGRANDNEPQMTVVTGPAGSGRSYLTAQFATLVRRAGGAVYGCECYEAQHAAFLQPILDALADAVLSRPGEEIERLAGRWLDTLADLIPEVASVCQVGPYRRASPDLEHRRAMQMVVHVLSELARRQPTLFVLDDLHHAGASTVEALQWINRELPAVPLMIVATTAPDHGDQSLLALQHDATTIDLGPISREQVHEIAEHAGHGAESDFIWELTRGHLLFVIEAIACLNRGTEAAKIPSSLSSLVLTRVRRAGEETEQILRAASFIGQAFDVVTLERLVGQSPRLLPVLLDAVVDGLLDESGARFVFANRVIRDVLYDSSLGPVRNRYHRALADIVEDEWARAAHLEAAGEGGQAAQAWMVAAEAAQRRFANHDVVERYSRAIAAATGEDLARLRAEALLGRGAAHEAIGSYERAEADHREAEKVATALGDRALLTRSIERLGWTAYYARDVEAARERAMQAVAMPGAHPSAWILAGRIHHWGGAFDQALAAYQWALEHPDPDVDFVRASALSCLGALLEHHDRYEEALTTLDAAVDLAEGIGAFRPLLRALFFQGIARANAGQLAGALTALESKATLLERYEVTFYRARTKTCLAWIWRELGDHRQARQLSEAALDDSRQVTAGELQVEQELHALCSLADCAIVDGQPDEAATHIAAARQLLTGWLPFHWRAELRVMEVETRLGLTAAEELRDRAIQAESTKYQALATHYLGDTETAITLAEQTGSPLLLAEVGPPRLAEAASSDLAQRLPRALRSGFVTEGRLARARR